MTAIDRVCIRLSVSQDERKVKQPLEKQAVFSLFKLIFASARVHSCSYQLNESFGKGNLDIKT